MLVLHAKHDVIMTSVA